MEQKLKKAQFGFDDYLESMEQMKNMMKTNGKDEKNGQAQNADSE